MENSRIKISSIVEDQVPSFVKESFPLVTKFLSEYYKSIDNVGGCLDILQNIDHYVKVDNNYSYVKNTTLVGDVDYFSRTINVENTNGFPNTYGLIKIDNEVIMYKRKTDTSFEDCTRGFSGIIEYNQNGSEEFEFTSTKSELHTSGSLVENLSFLFLNAFYKKIKTQFLPGFEDRTLYDEVNKNLFLKSSKDFYSSKGTDESFKILFKVLFGSEVKVIKPRDFLIEPSANDYRVRSYLVVEPLSGDIENLVNKTIFQDFSDTFDAASGSVAEVKKLMRNGKLYYNLNLVYDYEQSLGAESSIFGQFDIHSRTKIVENVSKGQNYIIVDSTVGFPESGELSLPGIAGEIIVTYQEKTLNQFLGCSGITEDFSSEQFVSINDYAYGFSDNNELIKFRITGVLSKANLDGIGRYAYDGDFVSFSQLGYSDKDDIRCDNWISSVSLTCDVKEFINDGGFNYLIETYDLNNIFNGDSVEIDYISEKTGSRAKQITLARFSRESIPNKKFKITSIEKISKIFTVRKVVSTFKDTQYTTDVFNTYKDLSDNSVYVASSSLPNYGEDSIAIRDFTLKLNGGYSGEVFKFSNHELLTGDLIVYYPNEVNNLGIEKGIYCVKRIDENSFKIGRSRDDVAKNIFISISDVTIQSNNYFYPLKFSNRSLDKRNLDTIKLIKNIKQNQEYDNIKYETLADKAVGILLNGVEILSYKTQDAVFYGPIESINVISGGNNYNIIDSPPIEITNNSDLVYSGDLVSFDSSLLRSDSNNITCDSEANSVSAKAFIGVEGNLDRIEVLDGGFNYVEPPQINISGGGGSGAIAKSRLIESDYSLDFNASESNSNININTLNCIGFSTSHYFNAGEHVLYQTNGEVSIGGISTNSNYYVRPIDNYKISFYNNKKDALSGINTISLTSFGTGVQTIKSIDKKNKLGWIDIIDNGSGYKNKKISVAPVGINTFKNSIEVYDYPYQNGEIIYYTCDGGSAPQGMTNNEEYYVTRITDTEFKLSKIGTGSIDKDFYYKNKIYLDLKDVGSGEHIFNYPKISVTLSGNVGQTNTITASINPVFKGQISYVFVKSGGRFYGDSELINFEKQPQYEIKSGSGAQLKPIISSGKIVSVIVQNPGKNYFTTPDLTVFGYGYGAILRPIIVDGSIKKVEVLYGGTGYRKEDTYIEVISSGTGTKLKFNIKKWNINKFERLLYTDSLTKDDGVIYEGIDTDDGLQYTHLYPSRNLRKKIFSSSKFSAGVKYRSDYENDFEDIKYHSPILGWAYDGNPIYGPYGYDSPTNKRVRRMESGYSLVDSGDRPNYPLGFFTDDYIFTANGDLDECNGRFTVTPEFPNGTYAYFMTVSEESRKNVKIFNKDKMPVFPYVIGKYFKSKPNELNYNPYFNQDTFDFFNSNILRNTKIYNFNSEATEYKFLVNPIKSTNILPRIIQTSKSGIESVKIESSGDNYKINDDVIVDNSLVNGDGAKLKISEIKGKSIKELNITQNIISRIEFYKQKNNELIGICTLPHSLIDGNIIQIESLSNYYKKINGSYSVGINTTILLNTVSIANTETTGITTYIPVVGNLNYPNVIVDDIFTINDEDLKVLSVDEKNSRIKVLRGVNETTTSAHEAGSKLTEKNRKFKINTLSLPNTKFPVNKKFYFNPVESLGIGTVVTGLGTNIYFSNPGSGSTYINIPQKSIYIENHGLSNNTQLVYYSNGSPISISTDGINQYPLEDGSIVYSTKISDNLIGISTVKVSIGTEGQYIGISQTASTLYFTNVGSGDYHSFNTSYTSSTGDAYETTIEVVTDVEHNLRNGDLVKLSVLSGITTEFKVEYDDYSRRLIINKRSFDSDSMNLVDNTIEIQNHQFNTGQKVIYRSDSPSSGLENNKVYYIVVFDRDKIKLSDSYYNATQSEPITVKFITTSDGYILPINPPLKAIKNQKLVFDLSDSSLSIPFGIGRTSSFKFNLWENSSFTKNYFILNENSNTLKYFGSLGVDQNARIELDITSKAPDKLYYTLDPINSEENIAIKKELIIDYDVFNNNSIELSSSIVNNEYNVSGFGSTSFVVKSLSKINSIVYDKSNTKELSYTTNSLTASGPISKVRVISGGKYDSIPGISTIVSKDGFGGILVPYSDTIGKVQDSEILDSGFDYPSDKTLRPEIVLPSIIHLNPLSSIDSITVEDIGKNYSTSPTLVVIDGVTNKVVNDIKLEYDMDSYNVKIIRNSYGFYNATPKIIPIRNTNGVKISDIQYSNGEVTVTLSTNYSFVEDFPFSLGDKILIEGISINEPNLKGYNSKNYNYDLFEITYIDANIGGSNATIKYSVSNYISEGELLGTFDPESSSGRVILEKHFPKFKVKLFKNIFDVGEELYSKSFAGRVVELDEINDIIRVETIDKLKVGDTIFSKYKQKQAIVKEFYQYKSYCDINSNAVFKYGWNSDKSRLSEDTQRIHDNDYYQYFSYSLKSEVPLDKWEEPVNSLNHTIGFKKFSDLDILTTADNYSGISTAQDQGLFSAVAELNSVTDTYSIFDFDLVKENNLNIDGDLASNEIKFNSRIIQDYIESIGNRVLLIDDISDEFNTIDDPTFITSFEI